MMEYNTIALSKATRAEFNRLKWTATMKKKREMTNDEFICILLEYYEKAEGKP